jgi:hypothetical protein
MKTNGIPTKMKRYQTKGTFHSTSRERRRRTPSRPSVTAVMTSAATVGPRVIGTTARKFSGRWPRRTMRTTSQENTSAIMK